jgi:hypothetical protein
LVTVSPPPGVDAGGEDAGCDAGGVVAGGLDVFAPPPLLEQPAMANGVIASSAANLHAVVFDTVAPSILGRRTLSSTRTAAR